MTIEQEWIKCSLCKLAWLRDSDDLNCRASLYKSCKKCRLRNIIYQSKYKIKHGIIN